MEESGAGEVLGHLAIIIAAACNREPVGGCRYRSRRLGPIDATPLHADLTYTYSRFRICISGAWDDQ